MTNEGRYPGVYVEETSSAGQIDGVATSDGGQVEEGSPGASVPGVPTSPSPEPPGALPVDRTSADDRTGEPVHLSNETAG